MADPAKTIFFLFWRKPLLVFLFGVWMATETFHFPATFTLFYFFRKETFGTFHCHPMSLLLPVPLSKYPSGLTVLVICGFQDLYACHCSPDILLFHDLKTPILVPSFLYISSFLSTSLIPPAPKYDTFDQRSRSVKSFAKFFHNSFRCFERSLWEVFLGCLVHEF